ncbi:MAG TPA: LysM domain-containing protein [Mycobacteriales bacterium]|nr:LysM domain-containing protein [Mycobacteriales bacterium]
MSAAGSAHPGRPLAAVVLALAGAVVAWRLRPDGPAGATPDADLVRGCVWAVWLLAGYYAVGLAAAGLAQLLGAPGWLVQCLARGLPGGLRRLAGLAVAVGATGAVLANPASATTVAGPAGHAAGEAPPLDWPHSTPSHAAPVVVRPGDTLWGIAASRLGGHPSDANIAAAWPRWWHANRQVIGPDPNLIHPGQRLRPPAPTRRSTP